jgi:hypothetical protein
MRKTISLLTLVLALCLGLTACGGESGGSGEEFSTDLNAFYESLSTGGDFPMMMEITGETLDATYPGLSEIQTNQSVVYTAAISAVACEIAMVEVSDAGDVQAVKDIFQARIDAQLDGGVLYPATLEAWEGAQIVERGSYVCLFVAPEGGTEFADAFNAL